MTDKLDRYYEKKRVGQYWDTQNIQWIKNQMSVISAVYASEVFPQFHVIIVFEADHPSSKLL